MTIEVFFSPAEVDETAMEGRTAVVVDVIRATSTIVEALASGARCVLPTASTEEAIKLASSLGREDTLLCGERKGLKIEGFDLGNSPAEYVRDVVEGKQLVMTTTNGTRAFLAAREAERILTASFMNLSAVVEELAGVEEVAVVCAGKEDRFSLDDALCAGLLVRKLLGERAEEAVGDGKGPQLDDGARVVLHLAERYPPDADFLRSTAAGEALLEVGLEADLELCAQVDRHALVPVMEDRRIGVPGGGAPRNRAG
jgi:2-phosphosulfolactate phosphatase